ncbi:MAG: hypothetical protein GYA55_04930 [SAR324 cluster bacterium]|uniref:Uncharacterized protein n=1 Tax=SAR324 cluster bacterium TaxID=2024889 RepID=A0A7X9FQN6_9DELT|nr:hypothetical protein [SAR324 cluster bacterium]
MKNLYVPYSGKRPALVSVNGHKLLILARDRETFEDSLDVVGADRIRRVDAGSSENEEEFVLKRLAERINAGVVVAASESDFLDVISSLKEQLPWIH